MPRGFGRLPFFSRPVAGDRAPAGATLERPPTDPDRAPVGPLVLLPSMIYHQVLIDSTEIEPAWLRSRPAREPAAPQRSGAAGRVPKSAASTDKAPTSKAPRRTKAVAKASEPKPAATRKPRRSSSSRQTGN